MKSPKQPKPTAEEEVLRKRQVEEIARLDDEENTRVKGLVRGRLGAQSLLGSTARRSGGAAPQRKRGGPVGERTATVPASVGLGPSRARGPISTKRPYTGG